MNKFDIISATTFQLKHVEPKGFKCYFEVDDLVECPSGIGIVKWLNPENGNCKIMLTELR